MSKGDKHMGLPTLQERRARPDPDPPRAITHAGGLTPRHLLQKLRALQLEGQRRQTWAFDAPWYVEWLRDREHKVLHEMEKRGLL